MLLAIEQGNTNTLFAVHDGEAWIAQWRTATDAMRTADEYAVWLTQLFAMAQLSAGKLDACIVSSVVPQSLFNLRNLSRRYLHVEPLVIGENVDLGIAVHITKPSEAGADRLVNAIGAHVAYQGRSAGHRLRHGDHVRRRRRGRGLRGRRDRPRHQSLHAGAARRGRPAASRRHPPPDRQPVIGADTVGAMQSGVFWGYVAMIEGLVARIKDEWGKPMTVVGTGGIASLFEGQTSAIDHFDHDLDHPRPAGNLPPEHPSARA